MTNCFNTRLIKFLYTRSCGAGGGAARGCRRRGRPGGRLASSSCGQMFFVSTLLPSLPPSFPRPQRGGAALCSPSVLLRLAFPGRS